MMKRLLGILCLCFASHAVGKPATEPTTRTLSRVSVANIQHALNHETVQSYVLHSYIDGKHREKIFKGLLFAPDIGSMKPIELGYFDNGRGGVVTSISLDRRTVSTLAIRAGGRSLLVINDKADPVAEVAAEIHRIDRSAWVIASKRLGPLNDCLRASSELAAFHELADCFSRGGGLHAGPRGNSNSGLNQADDAVAGWGVPDCSGAGRSNGFPRGGLDERSGGTAGDNDQSPQTESDWRAVERDMRHRAQQHREIADSLGKNPDANADRVRAHEAAALEADQAADAAEAQIPREPGTPDYNAGTAQYERSRNESDDATGRTQPPDATASRDWHNGRVYPIDRRNRQRSTGSAGVDRPVDGEEPAATDPRCRARADLFACGTNLLECVFRTQDALAAATGGQCHRVENGPAGGPVIECRRLDRVGESDDPRRRTTGNDPGVPLADNRGQAGNLIDLLPLGDIIVGRCAAGGCPRPPER